MSEKLPDSLSEKLPEGLSMSAGGFIRFCGPPTQSCLYLTPTVIISCTHPMPSAWVRFWQWALLGWRWEAVNLP